MKKVAFIIDNPLRDLPSIVLAATALVEKGVEVCLVPFYGCGQYLFYYRPDVAVLNYARVNNSSLICKLKAAGIRVAVLDTEGGVFGQYQEKDSNDYLQTLIQDKSKRDLLDKYFVWGENLYKYLLRSKVYNSTQLVQTGTPRMDFYHESLNFYFDSAIVHEKISPPMVLISSSFPMVNPMFQTVEAEKQMMIKTFNYSREYIDGLFIKLEKALNVYAERALNLAIAFPDVTFVFRPHPFENEKLYISKFSGVKNLKVIKEGAIGDWIKESSALIHFESSSSFEAGFLKKPILAYDEFKTIWNITEIQSVTDYQDDFESMKNSVRKILEDTYVAPSDKAENLNKIITSVYYRLDGKSHLRICDEILFLFNIGKVSKVKSFCFLIFEILKSQIKSILKRMDKEVEIKKFSIPDVQLILNRLMKQNIKALLFETPFSFARNVAIVLKK